MKACFKLALVMTALMLAEVVFAQTAQEIYESMSERARRVDYGTYVKYTKARPLNNGISLVCIKTHHDITNKDSYVCKKEKFVGDDSGFPAPR